MSDNCIFCKIIRQEIPSTRLHEDEQILAFRDIQGQAPTHILIIPKKHFADLTELPETELSVIADMVRTARKLAAQEGLAERGYRLAMNVRGEGGQTVGHVHLHLLGGRQLGGSLVG